MAIPAAQNSVVGSVAESAIGKAAGTNSMMRELGGVFGIAVAVAVFAGAGSYASAAAFTDGFAPAIGVGAGLALAGAAAGLALPGRPRRERRRPHPGGPRPRTGDHAMRQVMVRYKVKPERVAENEALVRAVYEELAERAPDGLRYATFRLDDGVSFVHLALLDDGTVAHASWPRSSASTEEIRDRCDEPPATSSAVPRSGPIACELAPRSSTSSCTPATAARDRVLRGAAAAGARSGSTPRAAPTSRSSSAAGSAAASSSARPAGAGLAALRRGRPDRRATERARELGASVLLEPREGPAGLAQRRRDPRGRRDRLLAAKANADEP